MIVALDVHYIEAENKARAAAVVFQDWTDGDTVSEYTAVREIPGEYQPGQFYRRELQCLLDVLDKVHEAVRIAVVDSYVFLDDKPGLGAHLWESLERCIVVVGVAKSPYRGSTGVPITRGDSQRPLFITAAGMDQDQAARQVEQMHGEFRLPTLLKRVDELARTDSS